MPRRSSDPGSPVGPGDRPVDDAAATRPLRDFLKTEAAGGLLLLAATAAALVWANSPWRASYHSFWETDLTLRLGRHALSLDLRHWVNEGLMAVFFLVVGLEVKRALLLGELKDRRRAALPVVGAVGGMVVPALVFLLLNQSHPEIRGWGIPMATDIAFALGVLALVGRSLPSGVRLFLLTLAIVDDLGAIVVIAVFYSSGIDPAWLAVAVAVVVLAVLLRATAGLSIPALMVLGSALWLALHAAHLHATLAGVVVGLLVPAQPELSPDLVRSRTDELLDVVSPQAARATSRLARQSVSQLEWLEHRLHGWSSWLIVPTFALANAGVSLSASGLRGAATSSVTLGVVLGLVLGKTVGITGAAWAARRLGLADLPPRTTWPQLAGVAALGGIGFTISLFITGLAFDRPPLVDDAKVGILAASLLATALGVALLRLARHRAPDGPPD